MLSDLQILLYENQVLATLFHFDKLALIRDTLERSRYFFLTFASRSVFARPSSLAALFFITICFTFASHLETVKRAAGPTERWRRRQGKAFKFKRI